MTASPDFLPAMFTSALVDAIKGSGRESFGTITVDIESHGRPLRVTIAVEDMSDYADGIDDAFLGNIVSAWGSPTPRTLDC